MKPKKKDQSNADLFLQPLDLMLDQRNDLYKLEKAIDWDFLVGAFIELYSEEGRPADDIRLRAPFPGYYRYYVLAYRKSVAKQERSLKHWQAD